MTCDWKWKVGGVLGQWCSCGHIDMAHNRSNVCGICPQPASMPTLAKRLGEIATRNGVTLDTRQFLALVLSDVDSLPESVTPPPWRHGPDFVAGYRDGLEAVKTLLRGEVPS